MADHDVNLQPSKRLQNTLMKANLQPSPAIYVNGRSVKVVDREPNPECFYKLAEAQNLLGVSRTPLWGWVVGSMTEILFGNFRQDPLQPPCLPAEYTLVFGSSSRRMGSAEPESRDKGPLIHWRRV